MDKKRGKKAQVTLFVIIAITLVVLTLIAFLVYRDSKTKTDKETTVVKNYLSEALKEKILLNILAVSYQGGYSSPEKDSFPTPFYQVPFWIRENQLNYPSLSDVSKSIDDLNKKIETVNLSLAFSETEIEKGTLTTSTSFTDDKTIVAVNWPIIIKKGTTTQEIEDFNFEYPLRVKRLYETAVYVAGEVKRNKGVLPSQLPQNMELNVFVYPNAILYEIKDKDPLFKVNNQEANFVFAQKIR